MGDAPGQRVFRAEVVRVEDLSASLRRIVFGGPGLAEFTSGGSPDEYLRVVVPAAGQTEPVLPTVVDGVLDYGSIDMDLLRTYTVRRHDLDAGEVTIDFVLHDHGVVTTWARAVGPGAVVGLTLPTGMYDAPTTWRGRCSWPTAQPSRPVAGARADTAGGAPAWSSRSPATSTASTCRAAPADRGHLGPRWQRARPSRLEDVVRLAAPARRARWLRLGRRGVARPAWRPPLPAPRSGSARLALQSRGLLDRAGRGVARYDA